MPHIEIIISVLDIGTGWTFTRAFSTSPVTIGRDPGNSLQLKHPNVAHHHAELVFGGPFMLLRCLPQAENTTSDGRLLQPSESVELTDGSVVLAGPFRLEIHMEACTDQPPPELSLGLALSPPTAREDRTDDEDQYQAALVMFASAFLILRRYAGGLGPSMLCQMQEPHEVVEYLVDPAAPAGRLDELGDVLAALVTRVARLACPVERWPT